MDYAEALARAGRRVAEDTAEIDPVCRARLLTHPVRPARSIQRVKLVYPVMLDLIDALAA